MPYLSPSFKVFTFLLAMLLFGGTTAGIVLSSRNGGLSSSSSSSSHPSDSTSATKPKPSETKPSKPTPKPSEKPKPTETKPKPSEVTEPKPSEPKPTTSEVTQPQPTNPANPTQPAETTKPTDTTTAPVVEPTDIPPLADTPVLNAVNQGDELLTNKNRACTIGYIDKIQRVAYTAAHCAKANYQGTSTVRLAKTRAEIGTFVYPAEYLPSVPFLPYEETRNIDSPEIDIVAIKLNDNVILGNNIYSGDTRVPYSDVSIGEKACFYGKTTAAVKCGTITYKTPYNHRIFVNTGVRSINGDSGGTIFIPGKGAIAITKGSFEHPQVGTGASGTGF